MLVTGEVVTLELEGRNIAVESFIMRIAPEISARSLGSLSVINEAERAVHSAQTDPSISKTKVGGKRHTFRLFRVVARPARSVLADVHTWKPEHRKALVLAIEFGAAVGFVLGLHEVGLHSYQWSFSDLDARLLQLATMGRVHGLPQR